MPKVVELSFTFFKSSSKSCLERAVGEKGVFFVNSTTDSSFAAKRLPETIHANNSRWLHRGFAIESTGYKLKQNNPKICPDPLFKQL